MMSYPQFVEQDTTGLKFRFGAAACAGEGNTLSIAAPVLAGPAEEFVGWARGDLARVQGFTIVHSGEGIAGHWTAPEGHALEAAAHAAYRALLDVSADYHLCRIWNFIPNINGTEHGLENYRSFCRARSLEFERHFGPGFQRHLPAASAVGIGPDRLALAFVASREAPEHFENPLQVPAFAYPDDYGPRPPSFARATVLRMGAAHRAYISGTAAIRQHRSVAAGSLEAQLECTVENLRSIAEAARLPDLGGGAARRTFRVYLRRRDDYSRAADLLARKLLRRDDRVQYLEADICRSELLIEIEATIDQLS